MSFKVSQLTLVENLKVHGLVGECAEPRVCDEADVHSRVGRGGVSDDQPVEVLVIASGHVVTVAEDPVPLVADAQGVLHRQLVRLKPLQPLDVGHRQRLDPAVQGGRLPSVHRRVGWAGLCHDGVVCP